MATKKLPIVNVPYAGNMAYDAKNDNFWKGNTPVKSSALGEYVNSRMPEASAPYANFGKPTSLPQQTATGLFTSLNGNGGSMMLNDQSYDVNGKQVMYPRGGAFLKSNIDGESTYLTPEYMDNGGSNYYDNTSFIERMSNDGIGSAFSGLGDSISNWWGGLSGKDQIGAVTGGLNAAAGLWGAYNQQKYADKIANLERQKQGFYEQQVNRQNQRQDLAQANYNKAMGV